MKSWLIIFLWSPLIAFGQSRSEFWVKLNINHPINTKWSVGVDLHHRRQSNFQSGDKNIFHYPLGNYARVWLNYKLSKGWLFTLSPVGYFHNEDILNQNGELKQTTELRISPGIIKEWMIGKLKNKNRLLFDARFAEYNKPGYFFQSRFRMQNSLSIPFIKKEPMLSYLFSNEILMKKEKGHMSFDQNRVYNALQWKIIPIELNAGYQWIFQRGTTGSFHRNQLFIMLNITV